MSLQTEIDLKRADIKTDSYSMSIGECISLYQSGEIDIHPEFQRFYRWDPEQKSRFIESILLGIPIPPIFVAQRADGVWDVVDGLQRLSTILELVGLLKDEAQQAKPQLRLEKTKYLPSLKGKVWEDHLHPDDSFDSVQRMLVKRTKIGVSIIQKESDSTTKYELFQRLNTGGSTLSDQEVRNCLLVMVNPDLYSWLSALSETAAFSDTIDLTDKAKSEQYDLELIIRFLVFRKLADAELKEIGDVGEFLTDQLTKFAQDRTYNRVEEQRAFDSVFQLIHSTLKSAAFKRWDPAAQRFKGGFTVSAFEAVAIGLGHWMPNQITADQLEDKVKQVWQTPEFVDNSGSGVRASTRIPKTVTVGRRLFKP